LLSPIFKTEEVFETLENIIPKKEEGIVPELSSEGLFSGLAGHEARGTISLFKIGEDNFIRFEEDFFVTNGPDLFVHLGKDGEYIKEANLGVLKGNVGSQNYKIPEELDINNFNEVWVWCRAFSVPFGKAVFK